MPWGKKNLLPYEHLEIIFGNENKPQIIQNRVALTIGKGIFAYRKKVDENGKESIIPVTDYPEITNFLKICNPFDLSSYNDFMEAALFDDEAFGNTFCSIMLNRAGNKVVSVKSLDATQCRIGIHKDTKERALLIGDWNAATTSEKDIKVLPFWDAANPKKYFESVIHLRQKLSGQPNYTLVTWNGTKSWAEISKLIPKFHLAGLKNGAYIKYHIKIPSSFINSFPKEQQQEKKTEIQNSIDKWLSGADNTHKNFFSFLEGFAPNTTGWEIERIEGDLKDDSYLALDDHADKKQSRGHDIHPSLSNIEVNGKMSSGSEILNLLNYHTAYKTQRQRERMCYVLKVAQLISGWPSDIEFGFRDVQFTSTDKNPTGQQNSTVE